MTVLTVHLPESTLAFIQQQVAAQGLASPEEYVAALLRQQQLAGPDLEAQLLEGLESGSARPLTGADWDALRQRSVGNRQPPGATREFPSILTR